MLITRVRLYRSPLSSPHFIALSCVYRCETIYSADYTARFIFLLLFESQFLLHQPLVHEYSELAIDFSPMDLNNLVKY